MPLSSIGHRYPPKIGANFEGIRLHAAVAQILNPAKSDFFTNQESTTIRFALRPIVATIDRSALAHNLDTLRSFDARRTQLPGR